MAQSLRTLKGVGEKTEKLFQKVGIYDTDDLCTTIQEIMMNMKRR